MDEKDGPTIPQQLGEEPFYGPFATVLKGAKYMVAVVTSVCDIYARLWYVQLNKLFCVVFQFVMNDSSNISSSLCCCHNTFI